MSLRVWLPLDGDLHNQGLSDLNTINIPNGVTIDNTGKIGKCYTSSGSAAGVATSFNFEASQFSIAAWVRINTRVNAWRCPFKLVNNSAADKYQYIGFCCEHNTQATYVGFHFYKTIDGTNTSIFDAYPITDMTVGQWTHLAVTYDGKVATYYKNGTKVSSTTVVAAKQNTVADIDRIIMLGSDGGRGGAVIKSSLNDIRIYDHCLSAAEVKEIAQGLIVHYKLDNNGRGKPNLALRANDFFGWSVGTGWQKLEENGSTVYHYERTGATSNTWNRLIPNLHIIPDEHPNGITVSFDFKCDNLAQLNSKVIAALQVYREDNVRVGWREAAWDLTGCTDGQWRRISRTYTQAELKTNNHSSYPNAVIAYTTVSFQLVQNGSIYIKHVKIEDGNQATVYFPASEDFGTTSIIEDSSGYQNHGRAYNNPMISTNTPRYSASTYFNGSNAYIVCNSAGKRKDVMTINLWVYKDTETQVNSLISCSYSTTGGWEIAFNNNHIRYRLIIGTSRRIVLACTAPTELNYGWNMITGTYENRTAKLYINGEFIGQNSATTTYDDVIYYVTNNLLIGATGTSDSNVPPTSFFQGNISDVRIYCTPLLDTDIKQLYNVGMKVDKGQSVHTHEIKEDGSAAKIKKTAIAQAPNLIEGGGLLNNITFYSVKPGADATNQTSNSCICDFSEVADLGVPIALHCSYTVSWNNMVTSTAGTLAVRMQGSNTRKSDGANVWAGANYIMPTAGGYTTNYITISAASGNQAFDYDSTIPASWFDTYTGSRLGIRIDYSDGNGTITVSDIKVTYRPTAQIGRNYIKANQFIER